MGEKWDERKKYILAQNISAKKWHELTKLFHSPQKLYIYSQNFWILSQIFAFAEKRNIHSQNVRVLSQKFCFVPRNYISMLLRVDAKTPREHNTSANNCSSHLPAFITMIPLYFHIYIRL